MIERVVKDISRAVFEARADIQEKLEYFRKLSHIGLNTLSESEQASLLSEFKIFLNVEISFFADTYPTKLFRIINNKNITGRQSARLQKISDLLGPPKGLSNIGRCNLMGESVFYAALDFNTAIWETQPQIGDDITVTVWKIKDGQKLYNNFIFHPRETNISKESKEAYEAHVKSSSQLNLDAEVSEIFKDILEFICEEFMKPVDSSSKMNYLFSSIVASRFFNAPPRSNGIQIDSISYPSTKRDHKVTNIAIRNSIILDRLDLVSLTVYSVMATNYDLENKERDDLIKISALKTVAKEFDFKNDRIIYDVDKLLQDMMDLDQHNRL